MCEATPYIVSVATKRGISIIYHSLPWYISVIYHSATLLISTTGVVSGHTVVCRAAQEAGVQHP